MFDNRRGLLYLCTLPVWGVEAQQLDEEPVHVELALEGLEDDVEHAVGVQVEEADDGLDHLDKAQRGLLLT